MQEKKYIAYVGTYTHGTSIGIHIYDIDVEHGKLLEKKVVPINNPSHLTISEDKRFLYSIADEGVEAFKILPDGDLEPINQKNIGGMRGCYISTDKENRFLFIAGYHDGRVTVMNLNPDGSIGEIADGIFHKGIGCVNERNFRPHINCVNITPDQKYLSVVDLGVDNVKIYKLNHKTGRLSLADILSVEIESAPRHIIFSKDGKYAYLICTMLNVIHVYAYYEREKTPEFELLQTISTKESRVGSHIASSGLKLSMDGEYLLCSTAGDNEVSVFKVDKETGLLTFLCAAPISGEYPKDVDFFPDNRHVIVLCHESNQITLFKVDYEKKILVMHTRPLKIDTPNCISILEL